MAQSLWYLLTIPVAGSVLGFGVWLLPVPRWTRTLKSLLALYNDLPEGPQREWYRKRATDLAQRIIDYKRDLPVWQKAYGWLTVVVFIVEAFAFAVQGPKSWLASQQHAFGSGWFVSVCIVLIYAALAVGTVCTFLGRTTLAEGSAQYRERREAEKRRDLVYAFRRRVRRRAKRAFSGVKITT
jgi:hypothetical protein